MRAIGVGSMRLAIVVSLFTGAVAAVQAAYQFRDYVPMIYLGAVIVRSVIIELGPVLTALVVGGRVGASIAAELGTMKVTEQIDAMETHGDQPGALPGGAAGRRRHRDAADRHDLRGRDRDLRRVHGRHADARGERAHVRERPQDCFSR